MRTGVDTALLRSLCLGTIDIDKPVAPRQPTPRTHDGDVNWCRYGPAKISVLEPLTLINLLPHVNQHRGHMMAMRTGVDTALLRSLSWNH